MTHHAIDFQDTEALDTTPDQLAEIQRLHDLFWSPAECEKRRLVREAKIIAEDRQRRRQQQAA